MKYEIQRFLRFKSSAGAQKIGEVAHLLAPGEYYFNDNLTILRNRQLTLKVNGVRPNYGISALVRRKLAGALIVIADGKYWDGDSATFGSANRTVRVTNTRDGKILLYSADNAHLKNIATKRRRYAKYFRVPKILDSTISGTIMEEYVKGEKIDSAVVFNNVLADYRKYFSSIGGRNHEILSHGDLWLGNIIPSNNGIYYIDFETVGERHYLFDVFHFMMVDYLLRHDATLLDNYFTGKFDAWFSDACRMFGDEYSNVSRIGYFRQFAKSFMTEPKFRSQNVIAKLRASFRINRIAYKYGRVAR